MSKQYNLIDFLESQESQESKIEQKEDTYDVRASYVNLIEFVKLKVKGLANSTPILQEIWNRRDNGVINDNEFNDYIVNKVNLKLKGVCKNG